MSILGYDGSDPLPEYGKDELSKMFLKSLRKCIVLYRSEDREEVYSSFVTKIYTDLVIAMEAKIALDLYETPWSAYKVIVCIERMMRQGMVYFEGGRENIYFGVMDSMIRAIKSLYRETFENSMIKATEDDVMELFL